MITTNYGAWVNHGDRYNVTIEASILDAINGGDSDWRERMETGGALDRIASDYRAAINAALPDGLYLTGDEFIGLHHSDPNYTDEVGSFDIGQAIEQIDLFEIIQKHDVDA